ncbi:MAG: VCBS repeat-containing protein [Anaerolineae bacterium]|nr:VCBS repeat-containing protein [Anaerolineae bacterium]
MDELLKLGIPVFAALLLLLTSSVQPGTASRLGYAVPLQLSVVLDGSMVETSSPSLGDLDGDGQEDIVVGGSDGRVHARKGNGSKLWTFDAKAALNAVWNPDSATNYIRSSPAIGDLDGDGDLEVVVSVGNVPEKHQVGGVVALDHLGNLLPGWPRLSQDINGAGDPPWHPDGYPDGFNSSPALGDLDNDGDLEIVVGGFDKRVYAWHHDGNLVGGWPVVLVDTVWSSPALADIDKDGYLEIVIGSDAGVPDPYTPGGSLQVFNHDGTVVAGFPKYIDQIISSSPAVGDLNKDGWLDMVVGTGGYYAGKGYKVYAWDHNGNPLPGWPVSTASYVAASPALGDIDDDGYLEVVVGCYDHLLYAWNQDGSSVPGWPVEPKDWVANSAPLYFSPTLADYDADERPEVFLAISWEICVIDGDGTQISNDGSHSANPSYASEWILNSTPAIGNIDADDALEMVIGGATSGGTQGKLFGWELSGSSSQPQAWPMFHHDARHTGLYAVPPTLLVSPDPIHLFYPPGSPENPAWPVVIANSGGESFDWTAEASLPSTVSIDPSSGSLAPSARAVAIVEANPNGYGLGTHQLGTVTVDGGLGVLNSPREIPVLLHVGPVYHSAFPLALRAFR